MSEVKKRKLYPSSSVNVDNTIIEQLNRLKSTDFAPLDVTSFIQSGNLLKTLPIWSYYSSTNNHASFIDISNKIVSITNVIQILDISNDQTINDFYKSIIHNHSKLIYRSLGNLRNSITIPVLKLLINGIKHDSRGFSNEIVNSFDFNLSFIPKLLTPNKYELENDKDLGENSIRYWFIQFYFLLCSNISYFTRYDLLLNYPKILKTVWKFINHDDISTIKYMFDFFNLKILQESNYKKSQKCKLMNENLMFKIQPLIIKFKDPFIIEFVKKLTTDYKHGIVFSNDQLWQQDSDLGVMIEVNNKKFKIANKLIYTLLTSFKPNESNKVINLIVDILTNCQELIPVYMNWLIQYGGGYHDPSLTSWWMSYTLLYTNTLQIQLPQFKTNIEYLKFDYKLMSETIIFAPLTKSTLSTGISGKQPGLINQLTLQLIQYTLIRLEIFIQVFKSRQELVDLVFSQLPDITSICQCYLNTTSKLIKLTCLEIIYKYKNFIPLNSNLINRISSNGLSTITNNITKVNKIDLIKLNLYMNIQSQENFKWWNKLPESKLSFFTILIKLASKSQIDKSYSLKIYTLLNQLCKDKMLFNEELLVSSVISLIYSLTDDSNLIWNLLDETVSRCVRTPYKYLDISHEKFKDTSIFLICLIEQYKFINPTELENEWLVRFLKYCILFGENQHSIISLVDGMKLDLSQLAFETDKDVVKKDSSIMEIIYNTSVKELEKNPQVLEKKIVSSDLDYLAIISLTHWTCQKKLLKVLFEKLYIFLSANETMTVYFTLERVWRPFLDNELKSTLYNEVLLGLSNLDLRSLSEYVFEHPQENLKFLWTLDGSQLSKLLHIDGFVDVIIQCINKRVNVPYSAFTRLFHCQNEVRNELLIQLIDSNLVNFEQTDLFSFTNEIVTSPNDYFLIPYIMKTHKSIIPTLVSKNIEDEQLNSLITYSMIQSNVQVSKDHLEKVSHIILKDLNNLGKLNWNQALVILHQAEVGVEICKQILSTIPFKQSLIPEFILFISKFENFPELSIWLNQAMLYVTKKVVESDHLSQNFFNFLNSMSEYMLKSDVWKIVPSLILNSQIDGIFNSRWINQIEILKYLTRLISTSSKSKIEYLKLFQIFINLPVVDQFPTVTNQESRLYTSIIVYLLFNFDHSKLSNFPTMMTLLEKYYLATNRIEDLLIKTILIKIESKITISWISQVSNWEFIQGDENESEIIGKDRLIKKTNDGTYTIFINKSMITNMLTNFNLPEDKILKSQFEHLNEINQLQDPKKLSYDLEFVLMLILNNEELLQTSNEESIYVFNLKNLIDNGFLQTIITNLSNLKYKPIIKVVLNKVLSSIEENTFKDKEIYKVFISTLLFNIDMELPHLIYYFYGQLSVILSNPGHFLYEKSYRYVLSHPKMSTWEIPLYNLIIHPDNDNEGYYREMNWLIETITNGILTIEDLNILRNEIIEFFLNLLNSYYSNPKLKCSILEFVYKIQSIDQGSDMLITRFGILTNLDLLMNEMKNSDGVNLQMKVNMRQLLLRFKISVGDSKRVDEWTKHNLDHNLLELNEKLA